MDDSHRLSRFTATTANTYTQLTLGAGTSFFNGGPRVSGVVKRPVVVKIGNPVTRSRPWVVLH